MSVTHHLHVMSCHELLQLSTTFRPPLDDTSSQYFIVFYFQHLLGAQWNASCIWIEKRQFLHPFWQNNSSLKYIDLNVNATTHAQQQYDFNRTSTFHSNRQQCVFLKADSHIACRAHAVPLPCRAAKGLECVFPIWFTQCSHVWFTLAMLRPCPALTMPCREMACGRPTCVWLLLATTQSSTEVVIRSIPISYAGGQCETKHRLSWTRKRVVAAQYKKDTLFNCWTNSSDISGYHADFQEGHGTVGTGQRRGMACAN